MIRPYKRNFDFVIDKVDWPLFFDWNQEIECTAVADGVTFPAAFRASTSDFAPREGLLNGKRIAEMVTESMLNKGMDVGSVDCGPMLRVAKPGKTFTCAAMMTDDKIRVRFVTPVNRTGKVVLSLEPPTGFNPEIPY